MNWKKWKLGVLVAFLASLFTAGAGLTEDITWKAFVAVFCASCITHFGTFLHEHPVEQIEFDGKPDEKAKQ